MRAGESHADNVVLWVSRANLISQLLLLLLNACVRVADVMIFTFVSLMPVHNVCRICMIIKQ